MNFPQVFDTWDSGSHGWVASLSRSLVLGSSSPRIGLLVAFWATFQARARRRNWARACFVVALSCVRIREHRDLVCARDRFQSRHSFGSSLLWFSPPTHPATSQVRVALGFASSVAKSEAFAGWCWCVWASGVGSTSTPRPRGQCLVQPFHPHPRLFQLGVYWRQLLVSGPECMLLLGTASWAAGRDELR